MKRRLERRQVPRIWNRSNPIRSELINEIHDAYLRHRLHDRHEKIIQRTKTDLFNTLIYVTESLVRQYQLEFDRKMSDLWQCYRQSSSQQRLSKEMLEIIDERLQNISLHHFFC